MLFWSWSRRVFCTSLKIDIFVNCYIVETGNAPRRRKYNRTIPRPSHLDGPYLACLVGSVRPISYPPSRQTGVACYITLIC